MSPKPQKFRTGGGRIDRLKPLRFKFDGHELYGYEGDTLASALLANGQHLVGRSFKYHRPRGIYTAGVDEPNALVGLGTKDQVTPNVQATSQELYAGLTAVSQNRWPSLKLDALSVNSLFSRFLSAGFYYKTFMWPAGAWEFYEKCIRRAAGMGRGTHLPDPDSYEHVHKHTDLLVVGSGPAGLTAALTAAEAGKQVILVEQDFEMGGSLLNRPLTVGNISGEDWLKRRLSELEAFENVTVLTRTTAFGFYEQYLVGCVEKVQDHLSIPNLHVPRQRLYHIRAQKVVLATGALERPFLFGNNDLPGIMLSSAAETYLHRFGVLTGHRPIFYTNQDAAYDFAFALKTGGTEVAAIVDPRRDIPSALFQKTRALGIPLYPGSRIVRAEGYQRVRKVLLQPVKSGRDGKGIWRDCDSVLHSAGWNPVVHLQSQRGIKPVFDPGLNSYLPGAGITADHGCAGSLAGYEETDAVVSQARKVAKYLIGQIKTAPRNYKKPVHDTPPVVSDNSPKSGKTFVDLQHDVTTADIAQAQLEGFKSVEHVKRYTTQGMASDQGKLGNVNTLELLANLKGEDQALLGTTTFRPPFTPLTIGAIAGRSVGAELSPTRLSPFHECHRRAGAEFITAGDWIRSWYYPKGGEDVIAAYIRETGAVRKSVGMVDVSSLGKIDIQGPDAAEFLNRVYINGWKALPIGKARYGLMLRDDGMVMDDGTTWRLGENHFFMTTTTTGAAAVMRHMEYLLQVDWPELKVNLTSVTDEWGGMAIAGPNSRKVLESGFQGIDFSTEAVPHMGFLEFESDGLPVRICRLSFSGELAYEVYTRAGYAELLWDQLMEGGKPHDMILYGSEALGALRIEKGHVAGPELDGRTTADDLGLGRMQSSKKAYVGNILKEREGLIAETREQLVGLMPVEGAIALKAGFILFEGDGSEPKGHGLGHVTSVTFSPALGRHIALGLLSEGRAREGTLIRAVSPVDDMSVDVKVCSPHFYDPEGERMHA